ncbi:hypothetical protein BJF79_29580 [Actinomadura sp. CNU-125]|uniref:matrixin family metalloprotease n=1 Tax=Actinomadura sp. CNU-125 TaxID=1904961 RepID=UPI0009640F4F|nr:matrixin family metalloprotease [Actinomadura sp. CNU-125]OLT37349.1 hypothetical protein BJF79_29580 [Actinomadura sp. CNU-125]
MDDFSPVSRPRPDATRRTNRRRGRVRVRIAGVLGLAGLVGLTGTAATTPGEGAGVGAGVGAGIGAGVGAGIGAAVPPAWCAEQGPLAARTMPRTIDIAECDLRGRVVLGADGLTAVVPRDGTSVTAHSLRTDGAAELRIEVDDRARQIVIRTGSVQAAQEPSRRSRAPLNACRDGMFRTQSSKWPKGATVRWRYHAGGTGRSNGAVAEGVSNIVNAYTDCRSDRQFNPLPNVSASYAGQTSRPPNVTDAAACGRRDGTNTFGWLAMGGAERNVLAATCTWFSGPTTVETDMALQAQGQSWWSGGGSCPAGAYATEAVATHEAGHVFGLSHVPGASHSELTMSPSVATCDNGPSTLGKGDYDGLIALYGAR